MANAVTSNLDDAWQAVSVPPGFWCVRRLELTLMLDPDRPDADLRRRWSALFVAEVRRLLAARSPDVVRYPNEVAALADAVSGLARGDHRRAWQALGLADPADPTPAPAAILAVLARRPRLSVAALAAAVERDAVAMDRALGAGGWPAVARIAWAAAGGTEIPPPRMRPPQMPPPGSRFAVPVRRFGRLADGRIRPAPSTLDAWAVLMTLDIGAALPEPPGAARIDEMAQRLDVIRTALAAAVDPRTASASGAATGDGSPAASALERRAEPGPVTVGGQPGRTPIARETDDVDTREPAAHPSGRGPNTSEPDPTLNQHDLPGAEDAPQATADASACGGEHSAWAGLFFLLAAAPDITLPTRIAEHPLLAGRSVGWVLHTLSGLLCEAPYDDAARLALAGRTPDRADELIAEPPPSPDETVALAAIAGAWSSAAADRLALPDEDPRLPNVAEWVAHRPGHVLADSGWTEVHLPFEGVDLDIRRAGLDADPGWLEWLGTVVRYVYE
jgi:hypothetical protein